MKFFPKKFLGKVKKAKLKAMLGINAKLEKRKFILSCYPLNLYIFICNYSEGKIGGGT